MGLLSRGIVVFCLLVMQNASVVLVMRYTRATPGEGTYVAQAVVLCIEATKLLACAAALAVTGEGFGPVRHNFLAQSLKSAVPALVGQMASNPRPVTAGACR